MNNVLLSITSLSIFSFLKFRTIKKNLQLVMLARNWKMQQNLTKGYNALTSETPHESL